MVYLQPIDPVDTEMLDFLMQAYRLSIRRSFYRRLKFPKTLTTKPVDSSMDQEFWRLAREGGRHSGVTEVDAYVDALTYLRPGPLPG
jgi:hypothetical protein